MSVDGGKKGPSSEPIGEDINERQRDGSIEALGRRIRERRQARKMTLADLAAETGLSVSMLSLVERGLSSPSIGSLIVTAAALRVSVSDLVAGIDNPGEDMVVRKSEQTVVSPWPGSSRRTVSIDRTRHIEISVNEWDADAGVEPQAARHPGYEYGLVLEGELTIEVADKEYVLHPGDLISYASSVMHRPRNSGSGKAVAIWINVGSV